MVPEGLNPSFHFLFFTHFLFLFLFIGSLLFVLWPTRSSIPNPFLTAHALFTYVWLPVLH